ncbi:MAG: type I restriction-modification system subunit M, partial [Anaerolineaceae bacterium]
MSEQINNSQREELHRTIWQIANDLRGAVDGWDFKQYVLGMLFYRYISENLRDYVNKYEREISGPDFDYAKTSDELAENLREELVRTKGFFILPSELFQNMRKTAPNDPDLNITLGKVFRNIENSTKGTASEENFEGLFDEMDVNSAKLGASVKERNQRLIRLLDSIGDMPLGRLQDNNIDAFGDAYEFLMGMYASSAGKSGGEFFTPQEVSELVAKLTVIGKTSVNKIYDPACGAEGLLIKSLLNNNLMRESFFTKVDDVYVFDKLKFIWVLDSKEFLPDSYTLYKNKIGLVDNQNNLISQKQDVSLVWPYKDCVLEGGQTKEDQKRDEILYNETLSPDEVNRLLAPKAL